MAPDDTTTGKPGERVATWTPRPRALWKPLSSFRWHDIKSLFADSFSAWNRHNAPRLGAALAFYALFSITPLLLVLAGIGGLVFGEKATETQLLWQFRALLGRGGAAAIQAILESARNPAHGLLASVAGFATLLLGSSAVFIELRDALNTIWEVQSPEVSGLKNILAIIKNRLFSFGLVLAIGFLLLVSLAASAVIAALGKYCSSFVPMPEAFLQLANDLISFAVIMALFAAIYKTVPDVRLEWWDVILGAGVTSVLFTLGKVAIGIYLGKAGVASTYGAAASFVLFTFWVYYSGQVFFLGAEFTKAFANRYGSRPAPQPAPAS